MWRSVCVCSVCVCAVWILCAAINTRQIDGETRCCRWVSERREMVDRIGHVLINEFKRNMRS